VARQVIFNCFLSKKQGPATKILTGFADNDIQVAADMTIKQIAVQHEIGTAEVYEKLRNVAKKAQE
jgi:hypothetical protein